MDEGDQGDAGARAKRAPGVCLNHVQHTKRLAQTLQMNCRDSSDELDAVWLLGGSAARLARWCGAVAVERRCGGAAARWRAWPRAQGSRRQRGGGGGHRVCRRRRRGAANCSALCAVRCAAAELKKRGLVLYILKYKQIISAARCSTSYTVRPPRAEQEIPFLLG